MTIFANCQEDDVEPVLEFNGSNAEIIGDVHANCDLKLGGDPINFDGVVTCESIVDEDKGNFEPGQPTCPDPEIPRPLPIPHPETWQEVCTSGSTLNCSSWNLSICDQTYNGDVIFGPSDEPLPSGTHCVNGDIEVKGSGIVYEGVTLISTGEIKVSDSNIGFNDDQDAAWNNMLMFSVFAGSADGRGIEYSGQASNVTGIIYAPLGKVTFNGSDTIGNPNFKLFVSIIADKVQIPGSNYVLNGLDISSFGPSTFQISLVARTR